MADRIGEELGVPVFLYGELRADADARATRAELRRGGPAALAARMRGGELRAGLRAAPRCTRRAARRSSPPAPPLVAFNLQLAAPATLDDARAIAALIREGGAEGLPGRARDRGGARAAASRRCR